MSPEPKKLTKSEKFLNCLELISVSLIALSIWLGAAFAGFWILFGSGENQKKRLSAALNNVNINWKIGLLLLIPLFYRTVREILSRIEEGPLGTKFPKPKPSKVEEDPKEEDVESKKAGT